ncbi:MAG: FKBP-type peptidyl-prolyl cis-trans isomerase [Alphaproteobacteria bacterium]|nr:FKBP-type peptidyl-prolyl cis-trans isomerase [Alphaproteobacteria bacterium]
MIRPPVTSIAIAIAAALAASAGAAGAAPAASPIIDLPLNPVIPAAQRTCAAKTASGVGYSALKAGAGARPGATDYALVNYIGYLAADGKAFDQGLSTPMQIDRVIPGFAEGLQMLTRGAIYRFCIPAVLGYGAEGSGPIPANADLVFQVELLDSRTAAEVEAIRQQAGARQGGDQAAGTPAPASQR